MAVLRCPTCGLQAPADAVRFRCECGDLLEVSHGFRTRIEPDELRARRVSSAPLDRSGVWRFRELIDHGLPAEHVVTLGEGNTPLLLSAALDAFTGIGELRVKHEGWNPTGSFKDRGMTVAMSRAVARGARRVACASTGNTAASLSAYAARAGLEAFVLVPEGATAESKLAQAAAHGARVVRVRGNFDDAMRLVEDAQEGKDLVLLNSINPFRIEGQKSIVYEILEELDWSPPDWIVFPAGNLGNTSAFGKALAELRELGLVTRLPRLAAVQAEGASPFARAFAGKFAELVPDPDPQTVASAIRIGNPVSYARAVRSLRVTDGVAIAVSDEDILQAKRAVDGAGLGAEPASCAAIAGARELRRRGVIGDGERVACVLTGHLLKDTGAPVGTPLVVEATPEALRQALG